MIFVVSEFSKAFHYGGAGTDLVCVVIAESQEKARRLLSVSPSKGIRFFDEVPLVLADGVSVSGVTDDAPEQSEQDETPQWGSIGGW